MYKLFSIALCLTAAVVRAAPTTLDAATLLKNAQDAQTLNREFRGLKTTDPCKAGQTACIGKSIARCQGTTWETNQGQCSRSQFCFALPSVSSPGTTIVCTSQKSAANLINASGATGGIFGQSTTSPSTDKGDAVEHGTGAPSGSSTIVPSTIISDFTPAATSGLPRSTPASSRPADADSDSRSGATTSQQPCTMSMSAAIPSQPTPTAAQNTIPSSSAGPIAPPSQISPAVSASAPPTASGVAPQRVTVTITLVPSGQETPLAPQTRTISPQEASALIASVEAASPTAISAPALSSSMSTTGIPVSAVAGGTVPSASAAYSVPTQGSYGGY